MAATTLNSGKTSETFTLTPGALYTVATTGVFDGALLQLEYALSATPAVFRPVTGGDFMQNFDKDYRSPGTKLRVSIQRPGLSTSINFEVIAAV